MNDTPSDVRITWDFGFPEGHAGSAASTPFSLNFLAQSGSNRLVGGLSLKELEVGYKVSIFPLDVDFDSDLFGIEIPNQHRPAALKRQDRD